MFRLAALALLCFSLSSASAYADTVNYTLAGNGNNISFSIDTANPNLVLHDIALEFPDDLAAIINGTPVTTAGLQFAQPGSFLSNFGFDYGPLTLGGVGNFVFYTVNSGVVSLDTGTFHLANGYTLNAVEATAVTPEPSSILLLATGLMATGFLFRRRLFASANATV